ncbi:MAG: hypothetical protein A3K77_07755 [Euryarchaeota archaeon RBG_13_31_8]|nr:MAG: hypothetical protein A3K77_07755 [Euryarchaeota archaeon RBG_13_31_8]
MKKKIICLSAIIVGMLIVLGSLSPVVCSKDLDTVTIEVNRYNVKNPCTIRTEVGVEEAQEIKQILINLNEAIENNDEAAISQYEAILNEKGIFGEQRQEFFSQKTFSEKIKQKQTLSAEITNKLCYFNAVGTGGIFFPMAVKFIEAMQEIIDNASSVIEALVLLLVLLPFFAIIYLFTHLIPFRILMQLGIVSMQEGKMFSLGLNGFKRVVVENGSDAYNVNLTWFTGATVNFIGSGELGGFLFVSGFAGGVKETDT